jgi:very-short-patch-repair endonuclease
MSNTDDVKNKIDNLSKKYKCITCKYFTDFIRDYDKHIKSQKHKNGGQIKSKVERTCVICPYMLKDKSKYDRYMNSKKHKNEEIKREKERINSNVYNVYYLCVKECENCYCEFSYENNEEKCSHCITESVELIEYKECDRQKNYEFCKRYNCYFCYNRSFVSYPKSQYIEVNEEIDPRQISKSSNNIVKFNCGKCLHKFPKRIASVSIGEWCPYCASKIMCNGCEFCISKSFASHPKAIYWSKLNKVSSKDIFNRTHTKYWFDCDKCPHSFDISPDSINNGHWCRYCFSYAICEDLKCVMCFNKSFASHPAVEFYSEKNLEDPRFINRCSAKKKYLFYCINCKDDFYMTPHDVNNGHWCPTCKKKTEGKFKQWFKSIYKNLELIHEDKFNWCMNEIGKNYLSFDFSVRSKLFLFEIDGIQHFKQTSNWKSPQLTMEGDIIKMKKAVKHDYSILRISQEDIWYDRYDWKTDIINHFKSYDKPKIFFLSSNKNLYNQYKYLFFVSYILDRNLSDNLINKISNYL